MTWQKLKKGALGTAAISIAISMIGACGALIFSNIDSYEIVGPQSSVNVEADGKVSTTSTARLRFVDVEEIVGAALVYTVGFKLNDGGSISFSLQSNDTLTNGIDVEIQRIGAVYNVDIDNSSFSLGLGTATDDKEVSLTMRLDNDKPSLDIINGGAIVFDSDTDFPGLSAGGGKYWGVLLQSGTLTKAQKTVL